ncbi:NADPH:quinone oxidoreductase family protein [Ideonella sp. 4Y11]|uniref:NADPH:quinone oxidoreductase family protein n=1 Tax=Ideonella aquatica TaxID=2824119 RepID=A0A940YJU6_9BURK|nr:NADPH:quinone oxidoreductase family protein [Ideonella aquatica]MBQ0961415.1 NADPH:quinone oxidoreductase family protein [Ideonella aquatica]
MHAWICSNDGGPEALRWTEQATPEPGPGQARVAIRAASLNFPDLLITQGKYQHKPPYPFVPGAEFAGVVEAVGDGVTRLKVGDRVIALAGTGGFATHALVDEARLLPLPAGMPFEHGAAFAFTYGTSHHALIDRGALQAGETVLVLGAGGGVGTAAVQIAKAAGARVIAGAAGADKVAFCREIGADETIDYASEDLRERLKALTGGRGPDVVYDPVGGDLAEAAFRSIAWRGRYLVVGFAAGGIPTLPLNLPLLKGASLVGVFWGEFVRREPAASARGLAQLAGWYAEGRVRPLIDSQLPLAELGEAFRRLAARQVRGKLVMVQPG